MLELGMKVFATLLFLSILPMAYVVSIQCTGSRFWAAWALVWSMIFGIITIPEVWLESDRISTQAHFFFLFIPFLALFMGKKRKRI